jgi:hypothetical protein
VLTISSTVAPLLRSFTGFFNPCKTGPTAIVFDACWAALYPLFPAFKSGKIKLNIEEEGEEERKVCNGLGQADVCKRPKQLY